MSRIRSILISSLVLAISVAALNLSLAQVEPTGKPATHHNATAGGENLFAVIGQVARPGVYRAPFPDPYLVDLIQNAGGFTNDATGFLRVIRRGPDGVQAIYASGRDFQLRPGDVVVANQEAELVISPRPVRHSSGTLHGAESPSAQVQLAFVNLTERPVVLKMRRENATLARILESLGQSPNLAETVQVISPVETPSPMPADLQLASDSVLVFDRAVIQRDRLRNLPATIVVNEPSAAAGKALPVAHYDARSQRPDAPLQTRTAAGANRPTEPPFVPAAGYAPTHDADRGGPVFGQVNSREFTREPQQRSEIRSQRSEVRDQKSEVSKIEPDSVSPVTPASAASPVVPTDPLAQPAETQVDAAQNSWVSVVMYSLLAIVLAVAAVWAYSRQVPHRIAARLLAAARKPARVAAGAPQPADLDDIIYDQLPVVEEPVTQLNQPPQRPITKQGGRTTTEKQSRVDAAHSVPRPHFLPDASLPQVRQPAVAAQAAGGARLRFDSKHDPVTVGKPAPVRKPAIAAAQAAESQPAGLLDRVLSRVQGAANR